MYIFLNCTCHMELGLAHTTHFLDAELCDVVLTFRSHFLIWLFSQHKGCRMIVNKQWFNAHLAMTKSTQLTPKYANRMQTQMSGVMGLRKEKKPVLVLLGLRYRILMPVFRKGLEKSITFSRTKVMVRGATARSALQRTQNKHHVLHFLKFIGQ